MCETTSEDDISISTVEVVMCGGTACHLMGGTELALLPEHLPPELLAQITLKGTLCMNLCLKERHRKAPFVRVGERVLSSATLDDVVEAIQVAVRAAQERLP